MWAVPKNLALKGETPGHTRFSPSGVCRGGRDGISCSAEARENRQFLACGQIFGRGLVLVKSDEDSTEGFIKAPDETGWHSGSCLGKASMSRILYESREVRHVQ